MNSRNKSKVKFVLSLSLCLSKPILLLHSVYSAMVPQSIHSTKKKKSQDQLLSFLLCQPRFKGTAISNVSISTMVFKYTQSISFLPAPTCKNLCLIAGLLQHIPEYFFSSFLYSASIQTCLSKNNIH